MSRLIKDAITTYIPGNPGNPGSPYVPAQPGYWHSEDVTTCTPSGVASVRTVRVYPGQSLFEALGFDSNGGFVGSILSIRDTDENGDGIPEYTTYVVEVGGDSVCTTETFVVYTPPVAATPAVPYSPPTPAQLVVSLNQGWNTHAKTIDTLAVDHYIEYTVKLGTHGALMAVGPAGMEGSSINNFKHGVVVDTSGIYVFENGASVMQLATNLPGLPIRIMRLSDGRIAYSAGQGAYVSSITDYSEAATLYVYGLLYASYDEVSSAAFAASPSVGEPSVSMTGSGEITMRPEVRVLMSGSGELLAMFTTSVLMSGSGEITATLSQASEMALTTMDGYGYLNAEPEGSGRGSIVLPLPMAFGSDVESEYLGFGSAMLPAFAVSGIESAFVPAQPTAGYINLPFLVVSGFGSETDIGSGAISMPLLLAQAAEGEYGIGSVSLPGFYAAGYGGFIADDEMRLMSLATLSASHVQQYDLVLVLNSAGELTSSLTLTREQALALLSALQQSSLFSMLGVYGMSVQSGLRTASLSAMNIGTQADLAPGAVWVVNLDTSASVQYEGYGFNSFFQRDNDYYGVANDGIYKLAGDTDAGAPIDALVEFARSNLGATNSKHLPEIYLSASSDGALMLKVVTEGSTNYYRARSSSADLRNHLVKPGKGLDSVYWQFTLLNENGDDLNVAGLEFMPAVTKRRI